MRVILPEVMAECRERARQEQNEVRPVHWAAVAVIAAIWVGMAALAVACVARLLRR